MIIMMMMVVIKVRYRYRLLLLLLSRDWLQFARVVLVARACNATEERHQLTHIPLADSAQHTAQIALEQGHTDTLVRVDFFSISVAIYPDKTS